MSRIGLTVSLAASLSLLSGCGGEGTSEDPTGQEIDLASIDACSFFDVATVRQITGENAPFADQGRADPSMSRCFWGVPERGVPAYVELSFSRYRGDIATGVNPDCTVSTVDMEGVDAAGATCPPDPQRKIYLLVGDRGIKVSLLVNEPNRPLTPEDLVPFAESVVATL